MNLLKDHNPLTIAIDGYSSCGKSTMAKQLAKALHYSYVDTGAMYRAVALYLLEQGIDIEDIHSIEEALKTIDISFINDNGKNTTILNGRNVEDEIRSLTVSSCVSEVAAIPQVRKKLVLLQRNLAGKLGVVMDGRDIGTVVFPNADIKFFLTANLKIRAQRRYDELISQGKETNMDEVLANLQHRDFIDTTREDSPLVQADDAIVIDNTNLTIEEQFEIAIGHIRKKLNPQ
ncbi:MAG: cytidylate kinase [Bacteroidetes bacterium OLB9]|nr:MAG: cytidylate kinase [Bacteroidetes bacterium OLB9]MCZ2337675.1 (d)CMP kinase [Chitinophagales bacterium]